MEKRVFALSLFLLTILLASQEMVVPSEAKLCTRASYGFRGPCLLDRNCALACRAEGFADGECKGIRHRCFCAKPC